MLKKYIYLNTIFYENRTRKYEQTTNYCKNISNFPFENLEPVKQWDSSYTPEQKELPSKFVAQLNEDFHLDVVKQYIGLDCMLDIGQFVFCRRVDNENKYNTSNGYWVKDWSFDYIETTQETLDLIDFILQSITNYNNIFKSKTIKSIIDLKAGINANGAYLYENDKKISLNPGRLFKRILGEVEPTLIEKLVNLYKASYTIYRQEIVEGDDILKWYLETNYAAGSGTLNNSCMKYEIKQHVLQIYKNNPNKVKMLCLFDEKNKLVARALLWTLKSGEIFMDRIYTVTDFIEYQLIERAKQEKWFYKKFQSSRNNTVDGLNTDKMVVKLDWIPEKDNKPLGEFANFFPYMDTLYYYRNKTIRAEPWKKGYTSLRNS